MKWIRAGMMLVLLTVHTAGATTIRSVSLSDLYREADVVAIVYVNGGDTLAHSQAIYRAEVMESFKGAAVHQTIYFGPYSSYKVGGEYVAFLARKGDTVGSLSKGGSEPWPNAAREPVLQVMYAGYSMLPAEYSCAIAGCDDAVSVPRSQVLLPRAIPYVEEVCRKGSNYDSWVRRTDLVKALRELGSAPRP